MRGESQKQRKTRVKQTLRALDMYKLNTFAGQVAKNWERAVRRHPPTTCTRCSEDLVWFVPGGCYLTKEEIYDGREQSCAYHLPANGKRAHRYA